MRHFGSSQHAAVSVELDVLTTHVAPAQWVALTPVLDTCPVGHTTAAVPVPAPFASPHVACA